VSGFSDTYVRARGIVVNSRGFSIVELLIVMVIFVTVMMITSDAFKTIVHSTARQSKSLETQISGIVGLEVLRADLEQAGFGLPWSFQNTLSGYQEAAITTYNDATADVPRAIVSGPNKDLFGSYTGSKYISIKSTVIANNESAKKWTNVSFANGTKTRKEWGDPNRDLADNDKVIVVKNSLTTTPPTRELMVNGTTGTFFATFGTYTTLTVTARDGETYQVYGIAPENITSLRMPFNRADYYLGIPSPASDLPASCAPNTGVLYKATINHGNGARNPMPLLDCVADLQIVYGLDTSGSGSINDYTTVAPGTAAEQRAQIKELRVYLLVQDGSRDTLYNFPSQVFDVGETLNGSFTGRRFNLPAVIGNDYKYYRWKLYTIVVRPKNLIQ